MYEYNFDLSSLYNNDDELEGVMNESADKVKRIYQTWSDTNLDSNFVGNETFTTLKCRNCGCTDNFEVSFTGSYETSARCKCGMYYIVHTG
jgi:hypothetical protein